MPKVLLINEKKVLDVPEGSKFPDIIDRFKADFLFGCRMGTCGTCRCLIDEGMENLNPLTPAENELFESLTSVGRTERLGCQLIINGDVKIRG